MDAFDGRQPARIIELMPEKPTSTFRLHPVTKKRLDDIAAELGKSRTEVLEIAIHHLAGTLGAGLGVYVIVNPNPLLKLHKRPGRAS